MNPVGRRPPRHSRTQLHPRRVGDGDVVVVVVTPFCVSLRHSRDATETFCDDGSCLRLLTLTRGRHWYHLKVQVYWKVFEVLPQSVTKLSSRVTNEGDGGGVGDDWNRVMKYREIRRRYHR